MDVAAFHQAEHFTRHAAYLERFEVKLAGEWVQRAHDVGDGLVAVRVRMRARGFFRLRQHAGIGFLDHLFAEIDADQVVLEDVVVEHILGGFAEIDDPFGDRRRANAEGHILGVGGAGGVIVAADAADAAGDEMGVALIFALHEYAVSAEDGGGAVALRHSVIFKIDFGEYSKTADDPGDGIPVHLHQIARFAGCLYVGCCDCAHGRFSSERSRTVAGGQLGSGMPPLRFLVDGLVGERAQCSYGTPVHGDRAGGNSRARGFIHERHELVREAGHCAADTDAANVGTAAHAVHPSAFGDVAVHYRSPAAQLDDAFRGTVLFGDRKCTRL